MTVAHASREYRGLGEAGGVKDVVRDMAEALKNRGVEVLVVTPLYGFLRKWGLALKPIWRHSYEGWEAVVWQLEAKGPQIFLVQVPWMEGRQSVYTLGETEAQAGLGRAGESYPDEAEANLAFERAASDFLRDTVPDLDVFHAHDAHTALMTGSVPARRAFLTIHNAGRAYQQNVPIELVRRFFDLPETELVFSILEGMLSPLLYACQHARLLTVSPYYAQEILVEDGLGESGRLGPELARRGCRLTGVFNGLDFGRIEAMESEPLRQAYEAWLEDPERLEAFKASAKEAFREACWEHGLFAPPQGEDVFWYAFHGRLTRQKGVEEVIEVASRMEQLGHRLIILAQGEQGYRDTLKEWERSSSRVNFYPIYDERLALALLRATDFLLMPSVFEPCALIDLLAMRMGAIPLARRTGGLRKIRDGVEGFLFAAPERLWDLVQRVSRWALAQPRERFLLAQRARRRTEDFAWDRLLEQFWIPLYQGLEPEPPVI